MLLILKRWLPLLTRFLGGQALIQIINLMTALLLLRLLPLSEYALFVAANLFIALGAAGSDLHLSTAFNTFGARLIGDKSALSSMFSSVLYLRRWLYLGAAVMLPLMAPFVLGGHGWSLDLIVIIVIIVLVTVWVQQAVQLRIQVLNIHQDLSGVFQSGLTGALARLLLTYIICLKLPFAAVALVVNLLAIFISNWFTKKSCKFYISENEIQSDENKSQLKSFIFPLVPSAIYFALQGQIGIFIISVFGETKSIAEVGALGRFGQVFAFLMVFNSFIFQPMFSRESNKARFIKKTSILTLILFSGFGLILMSAYIAPDIWLLLLGNNYHTLQAEVPIALAGAIVIYLAGFFYTLLAARAYTRDQTWNVALTFLTQIIFIGFIGVSTTLDVLVFNLTTGCVALLVQIILLGVMFKRWEPDNESIEFRK